MKHTNWKDKADWSLTDAEIARRNGITRQRVHQVRHELGHAAVPPKAHELIKDIEAGAVDVAQFTGAELAGIYGVTYHDVWQVAHHRKLTLKPDPSRLCWHGVDWTQSNAVIGALLRCNSKTVQKHRRTHYLPPAPRSALYRHDWGSVDWSQSGAAIAAKLGTSIGTVYARKDWMKRRGLLPT